MSLSKHPHVLRVRGTWTEGHKLYIALRIMKSGSAADVMHYGWPDGFEEEVIKCMLKQALEGIKCVTYPAPFSETTANARFQLSAYQWIHSSRHQSG